MITQTRVHVSQITSGQFLVWRDNEQIASFNESDRWGIRGIYSGVNYYGPNAKQRATEAAEATAKQYGGTLSFAL